MKIAIVGLGYIGLPLAVEFGKKIRTIGFDINNKRILELNEGRDNTLEVEQQELNEAIKLIFTNDPKDIRDCNIYIITVPTPIDEQKCPDLTYLEKSSETVGMLLTKGDIVIYESTVYPGATEEFCVPILEKNSGYIFNQDFYCGYSPERINPSDKEYSLTNIKKVTSGSTPEIAIKVDNLYQSIITAGTHMVSSIRVAEAAKVIENTQRDVNIALTNEFALLFNKMNIDTEEILKAAETKWNFHTYRPGLVGGHCIGVDPFYLAHKAIEVGFYPEMILAGRKINDNMGSYVAEQITKLMTKKRIQVIGANILIMGLTFKENCPDIRNTHVFSLIEELIKFNCKISVYDPWADKKEAQSLYDITLIESPKSNYYDAIVLAVSHSEFKEFGLKKIRELGSNNYIIYDIKYIFSKEEVDARL